MWTVIIVIIAAIIIWAVVSNKNDNEKIRDFYNETGGLIQRHQKFTEILQQKYGMKLKYDDGRKFCYKKAVASGELNIGLKLEMDNTGTIFSELIQNGASNKGKNVTYYNNANKQLLEDSIKMSIIDIYNDTKHLTPKSEKKYEKEWKAFLSNSDNDNYIFEHVKSLFIPDDINPSKFISNYKYKKMGFSIDDSQTISMNEIYYTPPAFTDYFMSAYPDVYLWAQKNNERVKAYENLDNNPDDYFKHIENLIPFYKKIVEQYKSEGNKFECC